MLPDAGRQIALDTRLITYTGVGTYIRTVFASLPGAGGDFQYLAITNRGLPTLPGIPTVSVSGHPLRISAQLLPWELRHIRTNLLHVPYFTAPLAWPGRLVLTIHDLIPLAIPQTVEPRLRRAATAVWTRLAASRADMIVTDSEFSRTDIEQRLGIASHRIAVVPAAVAPEFHPSIAPRAVDAFRHTLGLDRYVLCLGRDKPHKNLRILIQAFGRVRRLSNLRLVIVGLDVPSPKLAREIAAAKSQDAVRFVGYVPGEVLPSYYQAALAVVLPSLYEGFGLPALESMACGTPVVAANRTAIPEVVGDAALLVDPEDASALADAIIRVTQDEDLRQRLSARGLARARAFTPEAAASRLVGVYRKVLSGPAPAGLDPMAPGHNSGKEVA